VHGVGQVEDPGLRTDEQDLGRLGLGDAEASGQRGGGEAVDEARPDDHHEDDRLDGAVGVAGVVEAQGEEGGGGGGHDAARREEAHEQSVGDGQAGPRRAHPPDRGSDHEHQEADEHDRREQHAVEVRGRDSGGQDDEESAEDEHADVVAERGDSTHLDP
jgi:hypothetical protein